MCEQSCLNQRTNDDLERNLLQQISLLASTDDKVKELRDQILERSLMVNKYLLVKTKVTQPQ
jgi:hypothetical protein